MGWILWATKASPACSVVADALVDSEGRKQLPDPAVRGSCGPASRR